MAHEPGPYATFRFTKFEKYSPKPFNWRRETPFLRTRCEAEFREEAVTLYRAAFRKHGTTSGRYALFNFTAHLAY